MRIEDIDISLILPQPGMSNSSNDEEEEEKGFFAQLFKKKETPDKPFYEARIEELGYDEIYSELSDDPVIYHVRNTAYDKAVILTKNYLVLRIRNIYFQIMPLLVIIIIFSYLQILTSILMI